MAVSPAHFHFPPSSFTSIVTSSPESPLSLAVSPLRFSTKLGTIRVQFSRRSIVRYNDHYGEDENDTEEDENWSFDEAVALFNQRDYYKSHDALENLWIRAEEPSRTLIHGILQCAVGFHHLFNRNHKGAMMELGEGICKLRKMNFNQGPFHDFERDVSAVLEFVYQTQLQFAACTEEMCLTMDQTDESYKLLGGYAAGQSLYNLETVVDFNNGMAQTTNILFSPTASPNPQTSRVKLPTLDVTQNHLLAFTRNQTF